VGRVDRPGHARALHCIHAALETGSLNRQRGQSSLPAGSAELPFSPHASKLRVLRFQLEQTVDGFAVPVLGRRRFQRPTIHREQRGLGDEFF
jgi:hypothetical protein